MSRDTNRPYIPRELSDLWGLAPNLEWCWNPKTQKLFRDLNPETWVEHAQSPLRQLQEVSSLRLRELARDVDFVERVNLAAIDLHKYMTEDRWFQREHPGSDAKIGYFSPEFGLSESLPQYGGGLGILAGDHLKTASDLGIPLVAVGLFYNLGYFKQRVRWNEQKELYPSQHPSQYGFELCTPELTGVIAGKEVTVRIWLVRVGRVKLYLLDTEDEANDTGPRQITDRLYGGDRAHRIQQEIILGMFGVKALEVVGEDVTVFHTNEGHAGFLGLERIRKLVTKTGMSFADAVQQVRPSTIFTTHTPVPAGIDRFDRELMEEHFSDYARECGVLMDEVMALGQAPGAGSRDDFNMAFLGLRLGERANGVSALHGEVSRKMFCHLFGTSPQDTPIGSVTNGVHPKTWTPRPVVGLFESYIGPDWDTTGAETWQAAYGIPAEELWNICQEARRNLVEFVREYMPAQLKAVHSDDTDWCTTMLDPNVLTIGFARRAAPYKRLAMLLSQPERLKRLLLNSNCPVQFVFAGKAHPHDEPGKELIRQINEFAHQHGIRHRIVFLPDYNMGVARAILDADVWMNLPQRPLEASGTSGEKSVYHLGLQLSVNDGWWDEMAQDGVNGWVIPEGKNSEETANNLFEIIERKLIPAFYERDENGIPQEWIRLIQGSLATLGWRVSSARMLYDYVAGLYLPAHAAGHRVLVPS